MNTIGNKTGNDFGNEMPPNKLYPSKVHSFTLRAVHRLPAFFYIPFPLAHSPKRQPCVAWLTVFREKSRWKPAQAYRKINLPYPCLFRPHGVFPKRRKRTGTFPLFP
ncbi:MAG: hypothetical protein ACLSAW_19925 [Bacteroides stercoris]